MKNIFTQGFSQYQVNFSTLFRYARNRSKLQEVRECINDVIKFNVKEGEFYYN